MTRAVESVELQERSLTTFALVASFVCNAILPLFVAYFLHVESRYMMTGYTETLNMPVVNKTVMLSKYVY